MAPSRSRSTTPTRPCSPVPEHRSVLSGLTTDVVSEWPEGALFHSPRGLYGFQGEGVARAYWQFVDSGEHALDVLYDTGLGKTIHTISTAALLVEDNEVDHVIVVAESNKITDWVNDFSRFSKIDTVLYAGAPAKRQRILEDPPTVMVMTYETGRNDICEFKGKKSKAVVANKMLTNALLGKRVLIVFDEFTKLRSRGNFLYTAWDYLINRALRRDKTGKTMVMGLTGTKIEKSPEDHFNANRLLAPWLAPSVAEFERDHIAARDYWKNVTAYCNLTPATTRPGIIPLSERFASVTIKKRKTDPDVIGFFPSKVENPPRYVELSGKQKALYDAVRDLLAEDESSDVSAMTVMRQIAGAPASILRSDATLSRSIVEAVGRDTLETMSNAKIEETLRWAESGGDSQMVIFTFFGQSVLPLLAKELRKHYSVEVNHGQLSIDERQRAQDAFKAGDSQIFLSSDAGARGLNLGVGQMLLHYELPFLYSTFIQRSDRIHRIGGAEMHPSITIDALVAKGTVEEGIAKMLIQRNEWSDAVINPDAYTEEQDPGSEIMTAEMRRRLWRL